MSEQKIAPNEMEQNEEEKEEGESEIAKPKFVNTTDSAQFAASAAIRRKERRKATKKDKRKQQRREIAEYERREEEARLEDPEYLARLQAEEEMEKERVERELREFEEREKKILADWEARQRIEEEEASRRASEEDELLRQSKQDQDGCGDEVDEDGWEYVEVGPPEIIWQGNEIIVRKKKVKVKKKGVEQPSAAEDSNRPTSNPLPPQSESFNDYKNSSSLSAKQLLESVAQETPNFGTEQDKAHCPFHLKTGACRFGTRCSRIHFYPDKSCTLLIKNMYNGPGLAWEQDEGLECTDEEVEHAYEEFYEDVHTEFLKFGEIVNFKVCRNGSSHLRGNVYVHYKSLDSAISAYQSVNGRYFAGKQVQCEFVSITRWKVAICGEFMKSKLQTCSRGMTCNFIHCFRNPGGDYEWADLDKPPPRYWVNKMAALFGYSDEYECDECMEPSSPRFRRSFSRILKADADRYRSWRSRSIDNDRSRSSPENYDHSYGQRSSLTNRVKKHQMGLNNNRHTDKPKYRDSKHRQNASDDSDSFNRDIGSKGMYNNRRKNSLVHDSSLESRGGIDLDEICDANRSNPHNGHSRSRKHQERSSSVLSTYSDGYRYDEYDRNYNDTVSQSVRDEQYSRYDGSEEYLEDKKSKRRRKAKYDVSEEAADNGRNPLTHNRRSDSSRYSNSRKNDTHESERRESGKESPDYSRKSKRQIDPNFSSGDEVREGKRSHALEERGRWVPESHSSPDE